MINPPQISQQTHTGHWSVRANASHDLDQLSKSLFNQGIHFGEMIAADNLRLIQLWPRAAYLFSEQPELPTVATEFENMITDISHGFCTIKLTGQDALAFLNNYCSADLTQSDIIANQCLRTRLGHYQILIWWSTSSDLQILVNRSYAHSFVDYLKALANRN